MVELFRRVAQIFAFEPGCGGLCAAVADEVASMQHAADISVLAAQPGEAPARESPSGQARASLASRAARRRAKSSPA